MRLQNIINQTLKTDIPLFTKMNAITSRKLKQLIYIAAKIKSRLPICKTLIL
jgi:hypothetical protein